MVQLLKDDDSTVFALVSKGASTTPRARYIAKPAFFAEYGWSLQRDSSGKCVLIANRCNTNVYYAQLYKEKIEVESYRREISDSLALLLHTMFFLATSSTREPASLGNDGVSYYFYSYRKENGMRSGHTWSPAEGTVIASLVNFSDAILKYATGVFIEEEELNLVAKKLIREL